MAAMELAALTLHTIVKALESHIRELRGYSVSVMTISVRTQVQILRTYANASWV